MVHFITQQPLHIDLSDAHLVFTRQTFTDNRFSYIFMNAVSSYAIILIFEFFSPHAKCNKYNWNFSGTRNFAILIFVREVMFKNFCRLKIYEITLHVFQIIVYMYMYIILTRHLFFSWSTNIPHIHNTVMMIKTFLFYVYQLRHNWATQLCN